MHRPSATHWSALRRIIRYLKGIFIYGLLIQKYLTFYFHNFVDVD